MPKRIATRDSEIFKIGNSYFFRGTVNGQRIEDKKLVGSTFTLAKENKEHLKRTLESVGLAALKNDAFPLFDLFVIERGKELEAKEIRETTYIECESLVRLHLKPFFGKYKLGEIDEALFKKYQRSKHPMDVTNHRKVLTTFMKWCKSEKYLKTVPEFNLPKRDRKERVNLTEDEILTIFKHLKSNTKIIAAMALLMGMRGGEITNLTWDRIDFENDVLFLRKADTKTKKARALPLNSRVKEMLLHLKKDSKSKFVFPNQRSKSRPMAKGAYGEPFERARLASKLEREFTLHDLRATYEAYSNMNPNFTDAQREKMAGSKIDVQKSTYLKLQAKHLKGLENVVNVSGLDSLLNDPKWGKSGESDDCG